MDAQVQDCMTLFGTVRAQIRDAIKEMGDEAANWRPLPQGTNSVYAILSHLIGSDRFWVRHVIAGETIQRDREAEFAASGNLNELVDRWERAWADTESILAKLSQAQLLETRTTPFPPERGGRTVQWIVLSLISHYSLHLGHIQLTAQMWDQQRQRPI